MKAGHQPSPLFYFSIEFFHTPKLSIPPYKIHPSHLDTLLILMVLLGTAYAIFYANFLIIRYQKSNVFWRGSCKLRMRNDSVVILQYGEEEEGWKMQLVRTFSLITLVALFWHNDLFAQFRVADAHQDAWARDDKVAHVFGNYVASDIARQFLPAKHAVPLILGANIFWEIKDGLLPYEKYGFWGGDGFSVKDVAAGAVGIGLNLLVHEIFKRENPEDQARQARQRVKDLRKDKNLRALTP